MFYAHFVLSKKGPLAKVWLAAHWERKLTKTHVYETNIEETVDNLLNPKVKLALRTSGHLLLGVVRIHSRKARYLLQDCNEALSKIKQAFRPTVIDLAPEQRVVSKTAITLPLQEKEVVPRDLTMFEIDFDRGFEEITDEQISRGSFANRSRPEDITIKETIITRSTVINDALIDDFGGVGMEDDFMGEGADVLQFAGAPRASVDRENLRASVDREGLKANANHIVPAIDDNAHAMEGGDLFGDVFGDMPMDDGAGHVPVAEALQAVQASNGGNGIADGADQHDDTSLVLPEKGVPAKERVRAKRKRKLIVDEQKVIPNEQMKLQLQDASDIVRSLEMAPSTQKLMFYRETGTVDKLWNYPGNFYDDGVIGIPSKLTVFFLDQIRGRRVPQADVDDFFPDTLGVDASRYSTLIQDVRYSGANNGVDFGNPEDIYPINDSMGDFPLDYANDFPMSPRRNKDAKRSRDAVSPGGTEEGGRSTKRRPETEEGNEVADQEEEEAHPEDQDKMSRRTKQLFDQFAGLLTRRHTPRHSNPDGSQSVNFDDLTRGHRTRKEVAQRFYSTLVLKKLQAVDLEQEVPYGEIWMKKGGRFDDFST